MTLVVYLILPGWSLFRLVMLASVVCTPLIPWIWQYSRVLWIYFDRYFDPEEEQGRAASRERVRSVKKEERGQLARARRDRTFRCTCPVRAGRARSRGPSGEGDVGGSVLSREQLSVAAQEHHRGVKLDLKRLLKRA